MSSIFYNSFCRHRDQRYPGRYHEYLGQPASRCRFFFTTDFIRLNQAQADDKELVAVSRAMIVVVSALSLILALDPDSNDPDYRGLCLGRFWRGFRSPGHLLPLLETHDG